MQRYSLAHVNAISGQASWKIVVALLRSGMVVQITTFKSIGFGSKLNLYYLKTLSALYTLLCSVTQLL